MRWPPGLARGSRGARKSKGGQGFQPLTTVEVEGALAGECATVSPSRGSMPPTQPLAPDHSLRYTPDRRATIATPRLHGAIGAITSLMTPKGRRARHSARKLHPQGFDYGCLPYAMAVGPYDFPRHLHDSSVDAVAYGTFHSPELHQQTFTVSLVAQHPEPLAKAFQEFHAWAQATDPDSVELTFIFLNSGGYLLAITPQHSRFVRRCQGFDRSHQTITIAPTWSKPMTTLHPVLRTFRNYCSQSLAPFYLDAATYTGPRNALTISSTPDITPITTIEPLLKFDVSFVNENDVTPNTTAWIALNAQSPQPTYVPSPRPQPPPAPDQIATQRRTTLGHHFPVTLERLRRAGHVRTLTRRLAPNNIRPWQVEQALCNLLLAVQTNKRLHLQGLTVTQVRDHVTDAIGSRSELADGRAIPSFTADQVATQVLADGNALLRSFHTKKRATIPKLQRALASLSVLDAAAAAQDHPFEGTSP